MSVYALKDPRDGRTRYVGISVRPRARFRQHVSRSHSPRVRDWVAELRAAGLEPELHLLGGASEREWVVRLGADLNVFPGEDASDPFLEIKVKPSAEQKARFKAAADAARPFPLSLGKWLLLAGLEKLERDLAQSEPVPKKGGRR